MDTATKASYDAWRAEHDEGYCYDEIFNWVDSELSRGELLRIIEDAACSDSDTPETQASITRWADDTFGAVVSSARIAARVNEEMVIDYLRA